MHPIPAIAPSDEGKVVEIRPDGGVTVGGAPRPVAWRGVPRPSRALSGVIALVETCVGGRVALDGGSAFSNPHVAPRRTSAAALEAASHVSGPASVYCESAAARELPAETLFLQMLEAASRRVHA